MFCQMLMHSLAVGSQIRSGFALLARAEAGGWLPCSDENPYRMFYTLLEACRGIGKDKSASMVQAAVARLGLIALTPAATALKPGSTKKFSRYAGDHRPPLFIE